MGGCFSVQLSGGDALIQRCWDCIALRCYRLRQLRSNLQKLRNESEILRALKDHVNQRAANEREPQMKQLDVVRVWVLQVDDKLAEVDRLIEQGEIEKNTLCFGGYCSKTCCSSYTFATLIVESLADVISLKDRGNFDEVVERVAGEPEYRSRLEKDLDSLQAANEELKALKNDVIRRVNTEEQLPQMKQLDQVKVWISTVDLLIPEFDSLIRDGPHEIQKLRNGDLSSSDFGERVARALADVMAEKQKGVFEAVVGRVPNEPVVERPSEPVVGQESTLEKVWNCLMGDDAGIIGIYGMGGVGKTTLLTKINNRFCESSESIDFVIWVVASKDLRPQNLQEQIANRIGLSKDPQWLEKPFFEKAAMLHGVLKKKKLMLFIDDLWARVDLKDIGVPLPNKENKSKVVFTTRSKEVCGKMEAQRSISVDPLPWAKAWQLFEEKVGREALNANFEIPDLAKEVVKECAGLPLALVTVGWAMACKNTPQEWRHSLQILKTLPSAFPEMGDDVLPKLKFSYDCLPNDKVRSCLLYCCLFPEDYLIMKDELIQKWICESFWDGSYSQINPVDEGYDIVGTLVHACWLEDKGEHVKMHDSIRDMCLWIACEVENEKENYLVQAGSQLTKAPNVEKWTGVKRISLMKEIPMSTCLLTLFLSHNTELKMIGDGFFQHMRALRVLDLSHTGQTVLPAEMGQLVSLHYLDMSSTGIAKLPGELTKLKKLKYLNLERMEKLEEVPRQMISSFPSLQVLRMRKCGMHLHKLIIEELESLEDLKELSTSVSDMNVLHQLLRSRTSSSCIRHLEIEKIKVSSSSTREEGGERDTFGELIGRDTQILGGLHKLLGKICFGNLQKVHISYCKGYMQDLTWLSLAPNLTELRVKFVDGLEEIVSYRKLGGVVDPNENINLFTRLQLIELVGLLELKSIWLKPLLFPSLKRIIVMECPSLRKLPLNSTSAKGCNLVIEGTDIWCDGLQWEDEATLTTFSPCFLNNIFMEAVDNFIAAHKKYVGLTRVTV